MNSQVFQCEALFILINRTIDNNFVIIPCTAIMIDQIGVFGRDAALLYPIAI